MITITLDWKMNELYSKEDIENLPDNIQGVYIMENVLLEVFYVGKTEKQDIQKRIDQHFGTQEKNEVILHNIKENWPIDIYYAEVCDKDISGVEQFLKNFFEPKGNKNEPSLEDFIECNIPQELEENVAMGIYGIK